MQELVLRGDTKAISRACNVRADTQFCVPVDSPPLCSHAGDRMRPDACDIGKKEFKLKLPFLDEL